MTVLAKKVNKCLEKFKSGDLTKFDDFYNMTFLSVKCVAIKYLYDKSYIDDVVMGTYEKALKSIKKFDSEKNGMGWLLTIAKNLAIDYNKSGGDEVSLETVPEEVKSTDQEDKAEAQFKKYEIDIALSVLEPDERMAFELYMIYDMRICDVAKILGTAISTVNYRVKNATEKIKKFLDDFRK